ncbi:MAG TPA: hypothetical protein VIM37_02465 [Candidatus Microsaccharimonas sp.]|jgi:hypothetical protein
MEKARSRVDFLENLERFIKNEGILDVPKLGEHTRIRLPDKSGAQESLDVPIPLRNRMDHLIPYTIPKEIPQTADMIARQIGTSANWVRRTSQRVGIEPNMSSEYPVYTLELLGEELAWVKAYNQLDDELTDYAIGKFIGKDPRWVAQQANELAVFPTNVPNAPNSYRQLYPKTLIAQLRHILLLIPPARDYRSVHELAEQFGQEWEWVKRRLDQSGLRSEQRWSAMGNQAIYLYPPQSVQIIERAVAERAPPAGNWMTTSTMANLLAKTHTWVDKRLEAHRSKSKILRDDRGANVAHYPPEVFLILQAEADEINTYPEVGDYLPLKTLAHKIGRSTLWVTSRLPFVETKSEKRVDSGRNIHDYYAPKIMEELVNLPPDILKRPSNR